MVTSVDTVNRSYSATQALMKAYKDLWQLGVSTYPNPAKGSKESHQALAFCKTQLKILRLRAVIARYYREGKLT